MVLLSVASGDVRGLPSPETLEAVEGYTLLRTDRNGWIELTPDGDQMWVEVVMSVLRRGLSASLGLAGGTIQLI